LDELLEGGGFLGVRSWDWVVLCEQAHDTNGEVCHIFANHEGEVAGVDFLVVDDVVANLVTSPSGVGEVGQDVDVAGIHGHGHIGDVLKSVESRGPLLVSVEQVLVVVGVDLEAVLLQVLGVVKDGFDGSTVGLVAHVNSEPIVVVKLGVGGDEKRRKQLTEDWDVATEQS